MKVTTVLKSLRHARRSRGSAAGRPAPISAQPQVVRVYSLLLPPDLTRR